MPKTDKQDSAQGFHWQDKAKAAGRAEFKAWLALSTSPQARDRLQAAVLAEIEENPHRAEGATWAAGTQRQWAERIGTSEKTIQRLVQEAPFKSAVKMIDGQRATLIREKTTPDEPPSPEDLARIMARLWEKKVGRRPDPKEFGCLVGIAKDIGPKAPDFLAVVLKDWPAFASYVHLQIDLVNAAAEAGELGKSIWTKLRHHNLKKPSIEVLRLFAQFVPDFALGQMQAALTASKA